MSGLARVNAVALVGLEGTIVEVQTHIGPGIVGTTLVGLPDASLREAKERVRAALSSCGIPVVNRRVTVNLSPADLPKTGSGFDLAIAVSMLVARRILSPDVAASTVFAAELGLDGSVQAVNGALPIALAASRSGFTRVVVAPEMEAEASLSAGVEVVACAHLLDLLAAFGTGTSSALESRGWQLVQDLGGARELAYTPEVSEVDSRKALTADSEDLSDVYGQRSVIDALTVGAVGRHHVLMIGPPGVGKTMLAHRIRDLLPDLSTEEAMEVTALHSLAGRTRRVQSLVVRPPLERPHHSATMPSLIGGGSPIRPGAVSLAHAGVLVLDEAPEFQIRVLDALRQPLEAGEVTIHRANSRVTFPARFQMVMTANPCPCGGSTEPGLRTCVCSYTAKQRYRSRLSGPLLDRVDLRIFVRRPHHSAVGDLQVVSTKEVRGRVEDAQLRSLKRWEGRPWRYNSQIPGRFLRQHTFKRPGEAKQLQQLVERGRLSMRGADRVMRLAWSAADLRGASRPGPEDIETALGLRKMEGEEG